VVDDLAEQLRALSTGNSAEVALEEGVILLADVASVSMITGVARVGSGVSNIASHRPSSFENCQHTPR